MQHSRLFLTFLAIFSLLLPLYLYADANEPIGWHWYNHTDFQPSVKNPEKKDPSSLSPSEQVSIIKKATEEALNQAIMNPSEANVFQYMQMQEWVVNQSANFAAVRPKVLLDHPDLDNRIEHPTEQVASQLQGEQMSRDQRTALQSLATSNGILFFYQGENQLDELMCKVMAQFVEIYQIALIPISVDGKVSEFFPETQMDQGQAKKLKVQYYPAIILVNPKTQQTQAVSYGFLSQDELLKRFLLIANHFRPSYVSGAKS